MLGPGRSQNMGDGWETKRRRGPGHDWAIIRLGHAGRIGHRRRYALLQGKLSRHLRTARRQSAGDVDNWSEAEIAASEGWKPILGRQKLDMDREHTFSGGDLADIGPVTHVRFAMHPDGGVMRLRLFGTKA